MNKKRVEFKEDLDLTIEEFKQEHQCYCDDPDCPAKQPIDHFKIACYSCMCVSLLIKYSDGFMFITCPMCKKEIMRVRVASRLDMVTKN